MLGVEPTLSVIGRRSPVITRRVEPPALGQASCPSRSPIYREIDRAALLI
jgi:hypothetical protein